MQGKGARKGCKERVDERTHGKGAERMWGKGVSKNAGKGCGIVGKEFGNRVWERGLEEKGWGGGRERRSEGKGEGV